MGDARLPISNMAEKERKKRGERRKGKERANQKNLRYTAAALFPEADSPGTEKKKGLQLVGFKNVDMQRIMEESGRSTAAGPFANKLGCGTGKKAPGVL